MSAPPNASRATTPVRLAALLALLAMFGPFTIDAFFPAFHAVARALDADKWQMQLTISIYLAAYAVMSLLHGPLSDAYGRRRVILGGVAVFTLASVGCAMAQTIEQLLFFRMLQGFSTGAGLIVGRAIVRDLYGGADAQRVMSMITLFFGIAPALAPLVGGVIFQFADWHAVFWFLTLYGVCLLWLCLRVLPETHPVDARTRFAPAPLVRTYRTIGLDHRFQLLVLCTGCNFSAFFLYISAAPAFVEGILGLGTLGYPWFFVPAIGGMMTGAAISTRIAGRLSARGTVKLGYAVMAVALAANLAYAQFVATPTAPWAVLPVALYALGNSLVFPVLQLKMLDRYPANRGAASSMQAFLWGLATAAVASFLAPLLWDDIRSLAIGAAALGAGGFAAWLAYAAITPVPRPDAAPSSLGEVEEPLR